MQAGKMRTELGVKVDSAAYLIDETKWVITLHRITGINMTLSMTAKGVLPRAMHV
jgi:hypothetical protein